MLRHLSPDRLVLVLALALCGCAAPKTPKALYDRAQRDFQSDGGAGGLDPSVVARQEQRFARIFEWYERGELITAEDHLWSAALLARSSVTEHLELALLLAENAAEMGERRGFPVMAEVTDRLLMKSGEPQRYGTVAVYEPVNKRHRLYKLDARTTDEERAAMGIPPLAELQAKVDALNASELTARLGGDE